MDPRAALVNEAEAELRKNGWTYMKAPTGSGKTWMTFEVGSRFPGLKVYLSSSVQLVQQTRVEATSKGLDSWFFATWQKVKNLTDLGLTGVALVVIDEIHVGGVGEGKSIRACIENLNPRHVLYVSATPEPVNAVVFGSQDESLAEITHHDAVAHGLILPVRMLAVTNKKTFAMGTREQEIADMLSMPLEKLHETGTDSLGKHAEEIGEIRAHRRKLLLTTALKRESSFVYFAENVEEGTKAKDFLEAKNVRAELVSGAAGKQSNGTALQLFAQGKVRVLIACRMLREGWNFPNLEAVVDAAFSPTALHHVKQKAGRTSRPFGKKKEGRYYYCLSEQERRLKQRRSRLELIREESDAMMNNAVIDSILLSGARPKIQVEQADDLILSHILGSGDKCDVNYEIHEQNGNGVAAVALLRLAASGAPKPANRSSLGSLLKSIRSKPKNRTHQKLFHLRPEWLRAQPSPQEKAEERWQEMIAKFEKSKLSESDLRYLRNAMGHTWGKNFHKFMEQHKPELLGFIESTRNLQKKRTTELYSGIKTKLARKQKLSPRETKALSSWRYKKGESWQKLKQLGLVKDPTHRA